MDRHILQKLILSWGDGDCPPEAVVDAMQELGIDDRWYTKNIRYAGAIGKFLPSMKPNPQKALDVLQWALRQLRPKPAKKWHYSGDANLEYGGTFYDLSDWDYGYVSFVRASDIEGVNLIEKGTASVSPKAIRKALTTSPVDARGMTKEQHRLWIADACANYLPDCDEGGGEWVQIDYDGPRKIYGRKVKLLRGTTLEAYVRAKWLKE